MLAFLFLGKYSESSIKKVSSERTKRVKEIISTSGGRLLSIYALLGQYDLIIIAELPDLEKAAELSASLYRETGISFTTHPAIRVEAFDRIAGT